ncbi:MAG: domain protein putative component of TonB system, partial [Myxococcales bacterium]|nr:domain protein putative component of TonB system [Myxococcales bacterium]
VPPADSGPRTPERHARTTQPMVPPPPPPRSNPPATHASSHAPSHGPSQGAPHSLPPSRQPTPMPESATPEPSVLLSSDAITIDPDSAPFSAQPTQLLQPGQGPPPPPPRRRTSTEPPREAPLPAKAEAAWRTEIDILRREAEALRDRDPNKAALFYGTIAQIATSVLGDSNTAVAALHAASQLLPGTGLSRERWIALLSRRDAATQQRWERALELGRAELPLVGDPHERVALLLEVATIEELVSGDLAHARHALEEAREIDPANVAVLEALTEIYLVAGEWDKLVAAMSAMADTTSDVVFRSMLRHGAGQIQEVMLHQPAAARASYKIALNDDMTNLPAAASLSSLALAQEDWGELARILVAESDLVDDPRTIRRLTERAADLYWERLGDAENAISAYRRAALATPDEAAPLRKLAAVLESNGRWRELVDVYVAELPLIKDPEERADLYHRIGEVYEHSLGRTDDAVGAYRNALEAMPTHMPTLQALGALYRQAERWSDLADMDLREAERISDPERRAARYYEVADNVERRLGDQPHAVSLYERCLDLVPGHRAAFVALDALYRREERWRDIVALYERQAQAVTDPKLVRFYKQEIGRLWRERVPNADKAAQALRDALSIDAADLAPLLHLATTLEQAQRWEPVVDILEKLVAQLAEPVDRIAMLHRLARVLETQLAQEEKALAAHGRVLELASTNETSLRAIGRLHYRAGRWLDVITSYGKQLPLATTPEEQAALYYRIGRVYERKLGRRDDALTAYEVSLDHDPAYRPALRALDRILRRDRIWPRLLTVLEKQARTSRTPSARAHIHHARGQIFELHLRDLEKAEKEYAQAVKLSPLFEAAVAALGHVRESRGQYEALEELYTDLLARTQTAAARVSVLSRLAPLYELRLNQPARAALAYREAYEASPLGQPLRLAELRAMRLEGGAGPTVQALSALGSRTSDKRLALGYRTLAALRDEVSAAARGTRPSSQLFLDAAGLGQQDPVVADGVVRTLQRAPGSDSTAKERLPGALVERASQCDSAQARALILFEAACLFDRVGRARDAALAYEQAGNAVSDFLPVLRGVRRIAGANEQWSAVAALLAHEAEVAADADNRAGALVAAAEIALSKLNEPRAALHHYKRLLELQPSHDRAFSRAVGLYEKLNDFPGLLELLQARTAATDEAAGKAQLLRRQAELLRDRLGDVRGAVAALQQSIDVLPSDLESYLALAPLLEQLRWWQDAAQTYRQISELVPGDETSRAARLKEAEIRESELGDREAARLILEELVVDPSDEQAARYMAQLCERMGRWDRARDLWLSLARTRDGKKRTDALMSLGFVMADGFDDREASERAFDEAMAIATQDPKVAEMVEQRFRQGGDWASFAASGERVLARVRGGDSQVVLRMMVARAYQEELHRPDLAQNHLTVAIGLSPEDPLPSVKLAKLHVDNGRADLALPEFRRALEIAPLHGEALRGLGGAFIRTGAADAGRFLDEIAAMAEGSASPGKALSPLIVKRPLDPGEWAAFFPRTSSAPVRAVGEIARMLEPFAAPLLVEVTGQIPRGDLLPEANPVSLRVRAVVTALGLEPMRVFVDPPNGRDVKLCADAKLAFTAGGTLASSKEQGRLTFEVARLSAWTAAGATIGAFLATSEVAAFLQAVGTDGGGEDIKELRRRVQKPLPRKVRKEVERIITEQIRDLPRAAAEWHTEEQRWADRLAFLLSRDAVAAVEGAANGKDPRTTARALDLVRYLASESCWRAYVRLAA